MLRRGQTAKGSCYAQTRHVPFNRRLLAAMRNRVSGTRRGGLLGSPGTGAEGGPGCSGLFSKTGSQARTRWLDFEGSFTRRLGPPGAAAASRICSPPFADPRLPREPAEPRAGPPPGSESTTRRREQDPCSAKSPPSGTSSSIRPRTEASESVPLPLALLRGRGRSKPFVRSCNSGICVADSLRGAWIPTSIRVGGVGASRSKTRVCAGTGSGRAYFVRLGDAPEFHQFTMKFRES